VFHDVSEAAGIKFEGFGHSATICDINHDGWKDIYVSDDFISNNILYINNHDGTFTNRLKDYFKHTTFNSMGQDVVDLNNDGLPDVVELDMSPPDNYRKKMMSASESYVTYQNFDVFGYEYQYVRNTLQLNRGPRVLENDSIGMPAFSEIGFLSGISQTDWSWSPLVADFDNDGFRDIYITNGFPRDVSDHDFIAYRNQSKGLVSNKEIINQIPEVKLNNYSFRNNGDLFSNSSKLGMEQPTFSSHVPYRFDNDGALDGSEPSTMKPCYTGIRPVIKTVQTITFFKSNSKAINKILTDWVLSPVFTMITENYRSTKIILTAGICPACRVSHISD
jgi:hypothetical protein